MSDKENEKQKLLRTIKIWQKADKWFLVAMIALFLAAMVNIAVMEFVTKTFTIAFLSITLGLAMISGAVWFFGDRKIRKMKKAVSAYDDSLEEQRKEIL